MEHQHGDRLLPNILSISFHNNNCFLTFDVKLMLLLVPYFDHLASYFVSPLYPCKHNGKSNPDQNPVSKSYYKANHKVYIQRVNTLQ